MSAEKPLLAVKDLVTRFDIRSGIFRRVSHRVHAVEKATFEIGPGETLALVGESGSGKSTIGRSILQLDIPRSGSVRFEGRELLGLSHNELRTFRKNAQIIFQDPFGSLDPRMTVGRIIAEPMIIHGEAKKEEIRQRVLGLLERVDLGAEHLSRYPHAFSGGQRQRICIARALSLNPSLIIADESVAALDVTIQAQVINLLMDLQAEENISFLFISHDMAVVERIAHRVAVMYAGYWANFARTGDPNSGPGVSAAAVGAAPFEADAEAKLPGWPQWLPAALSPLFVPTTTTISPTSSTRPRATARPRPARTSSTPPWAGAAPAPPRPSH